MCRLYGFRSNDRTKVECSLVYGQNAIMSQSRADLHGRAHPDGWGIAFYDDGLPQVERRDTAAFADGRFSLTAERVYARTVVAHVRLATVGRAALVNTHPFTSGRWTFAHNGTIHAFARVERRMVEETDADLLAARRGGTDSELAFLWILSRLRRHATGGAEGATTSRALASEVADAVFQLEAWSVAAEAPEPSKLNVLLTDGRVLVASRWRNSLYWVERRGVRDCEICGIPHVDTGAAADYRAVVVASEPITRESWSEVPEGSVLAVDPALGTEIRPIAPP